MPKKTSKYYSNNATFLGWGEGAILDRERLRLIDRYTVGRNILDIGCGLGLYVDYVSSKGLSGVGIDNVSEFIKSAKKSKKGDFFKANIEKLPFRENQFDTSFMFDILEHADDKKILTEAKRVTAKRIMVIVPRRVDTDLEQSGVVFRHYIDKSHIREYREEDLKRLAKSTGLKLTLIKKIHLLYNETIFLSLFGGSVFLKKLIRKAVFLILPKAYYPTEYFAVFEK